MLRFYFRENEIDNENFLVICCFLFVALMESASWFYDKDCFIMQKHTKTDLYKQKSIFNIHNLI